MLCKLPAYRDAHDAQILKVMPWAGTHKGPQALFDVFAAIQRFCDNEHLIAFSESAQHGIRQTTG